jgi:hypothetical protein
MLKHRAIRLFSVLSYPTVLVSSAVIVKVSVAEHGIIDLQENKLLKIKDKKGLFAIEWE